MSNNNFRGWQVLQEMPEGWKVDRTTGSPLAGHVFITNGKSVLNGQKRALLACNMAANVSEVAGDKIQISNEKPNHIKTLSYDDQISSSGFRRSVNEMARETFKLNLLRDIMCDLTICEIEGWCKTEYINQIKKMVAEIGIGKTIDSNKNTDVVQV